MSGNDQTKDSGGIVPSPGPENYEDHDDLDNLFDFLGDPSTRQPSEPEPPGDTIAGAVKTPPTPTTRQASRQKRTLADANVPNESGKELKIPIKRAPVKTVPIKRPPSVRLVTDVPESEFDSVTQLHPARSERKPSASPAQSDDRGTDEDQGAEEFDFDFLSSENKVSDPLDDTNEFDRAGVGPAFVDLGDPTSPRRLPLAAAALSVIAALGGGFWLYQQSLPSGDSLTSKDSLELADSSRPEAVGEAEVTVPVITSSTTSSSTMAERRDETLVEIRNMIDQQQLDTAENTLASLDPVLFGYGYPEFTALQQEIADRRVDPDAFVVTSSSNVETEALSSERVAQNELDKAAEEERLAIEQRDAELQRRAEEARLAENARAEEQARLEEETRLAREAAIKAQEATRLAQAALQAEEAARQAEIARVAEQVRLAEEARLANEAQLAEQARLAEEAQLAEQARLAEEAQLA
ncbi:MAG: hypothetical protein KTR32_25975, partial [Granulosicoccus sp.]|nr:hypothetical protein [Granulosicoccus sp.]